MSRRGVFSGLMFNRMVDRPATNEKSMALMWGLAWLIVGVILCWYLDLVPTSMFGYTWGAVSLAWNTALGLVMWVSSTVVFYGVALLFNRKVSVTELFGRMLFAHWPVTLMLLPAVVGDKVAYSTFMSHPAVVSDQVPLYGVLMSIFSAVVLVWYFYWGLCAFRRSLSRSGAVVFVAYVVAFVLSFLLSEYTLDAVYAGIGR
ncbi:MAG: hypothetical protein IJX40_01210 [Alistipes sp.]|nr:hypothetical protein [Alistipes sp.]